MLFAPLRAGEVVRPWLLARTGEVPFVKAAGTVAAERIVDGLMLALLLSGSLVSTTPLSPLPNRLGKLALPVSVVPGSGQGDLGAFGAAFAAMALVLFLPRARAPHRACGFES